MRPPRRWSSIVAGRNAVATPRGCFLLLAFTLTALPLASAVVQTSEQQSDQASDESASPATQVDIRDVVARVFGRGDGGSTHESAELDVGDSRLFLFPTFGGNPAIGFAVGALVNLTNYWGDPATTPLSSMLVSVSFTTKKQMLIAARSDFYTPNDTWHLAGDWRFYRFQERTHGLGSDQPSSTFADVDYDWLRLHQTVYRPVWAGLELGVGYHFDAHQNIALNDEQPKQFLDIPDPVEFESTRASGVSANVVFDRRDHPLNPLSGVLGRATYTWFREALGGTSDWDSLQLEGRAYLSLPGGRQHRIGMWGIGWLTKGDAPYFNLPSVGWDTYGRTGRGYRAGRFRGQDWVYTELEYRTDVTRNGLIGAVAFVNTGTLSDESGNFGRWIVGGGVGARLKLDKQRRSNIGVDIAWGREGSFGLFLGLNEAF